MTLNNKYQHGKIYIVNKQFFFKPGRSLKNQSIHLPDFDTKAIYMLRDIHSSKDTLHTNASNSNCNLVTLDPS